MDTQGLVSLLRHALPGLISVYGFGSRVVDGGCKASADSDLDLAVLVEGYANPVTLFELAGKLADFVHYPVDLLDLRAASTVMQHQILTQGECWWAADVRAGLFEAAMLTEKLHLDAMRQPAVDEILQQGRVYGR